MTALPTLRTRVKAQFPTAVVGVGGAGVVKRNGIYTISLRFEDLIVLTPQPSSLATDYVVVFDAATGEYFKLSLVQLAASVQAAPPTFLTSAGTYTVTDEMTLLINRDVAAAADIQLPPALSRNGAPIVIKDYAGNAATYNSTILPDGEETIDGLTGLPINANGGGYKLVPISTGGWYISP